MILVCPIGSDRGFQSVSAALNPRKMTTAGGESNLPFKFRRPHQRRRRWANVQIYVIQMFCFCWDSLPSPQNVECCHNYLIICVFSQIIFIVYLTVDKKLKKTLNASHASTFVIIALYIICFIIRGIVHMHMSDRPTYNLSSNSPPVHFYL